MKPELNRTQAIYPPEGPKPKVCVTTTNIKEVVTSTQSNRMEPITDRRRDVEPTKTTMTTMTTKEATMTAGEEVDC